MRRTAPAVTIRTVRANDGLYLHFHAARPGCADLRITLDDETVLRAARTDLDQRLTALKDELSGMEVTDADAAEVYRRFWQIGNRQLFLIFHRRVAAELTRWWRSALPAARNPRFVPMIECVGELGAMLPIEYLPLLDPRPADVRTRADLVRACRNVVGFTAMVRRSFGNLPVPQNITLRATEHGRLPVRFFQHDGLPGARLELKWFTTAAEQHAQVTTFPTAETDGPTLADQISAPCPAAGGTPTPCSISPATATPARTGRWPTRSSCPAAAAPSG
ncbi:hypothetical protein [Paractinoplanes durhamensis]|uniref:hypothetical protein n=1 Tax=Paractinoplanes durhamensis TaxID=113563 RepID=UPI0036424966